MGGRRLFAVLVTALVLACLGAAPALAACPGLNLATASVDDGGEVTLCLINVQRSVRGLRPLRADAALERAARGHSLDMVRRDYFSHTSPGGADFMDRIRRAGWRGRGSWTTGENIAWGTGRLGDPHGIVDSWMRSPGHRANILSRRFKEIGVGIARGAPGRGSRGGTYTTDFAG